MKLSHRLSRLGLLLGIVVGGGIVHVHAGKLLDRYHLRADSALHRRLLNRLAETGETAPSVFRRDYTCSAGNPCSNGACCGGSGFCGYGPTYCGDSCLSNCDAVAECGQYSSPANVTCPLNVCCSEFGFCGTTEEFCNDKCQSHCDLDVSPPEGSSTGQALSKVIGYYEAWNDVSKCKQTKASDLPVDALTHINYAFAYIDPSSFLITTMDSTVPASVFSDLADLKTANPDLKIFVSIGGWSFSDNNTATQPVFGNIASSAANRKTFADNTLSFLNIYGFDGVDIDWEYPGAPDRGGSKKDTENYVALLKTLRQTFDNSGANLGISFTAPSSYWYMQWFDIPGLLKYADWVNLMTYDLHGVWDSTNPIGAIVQAHTNLTEIKLAVELLWRVDVKPSQVVMGFGFYGRAFTLADSSCTDVGCPFSSGAKPGPCTATSGYLAYYEIEQVIKNNSGVDVIWDKDAAVKYFTWDTDQWISYDDADTFKQKVDWANSVGIGGSVIWASDLDDYEWTAHKALTGKTDLGTVLSKKSVGLSTSVPADLNSFLSQDCYKFPDAVDLDKPMVATCSRGYTRVGYDKNGCKGKDGTCGRPICCPLNSGLKKCQWRGSGGDCNGQCHAGEVKITTSSWGGTPGESGTHRCSRGTKAFCCEVGIYETLNSGCYWSDLCGKKCKSDEQEIAHMYDPTGWATVFCHGSSYCCPGSEPAPYTKCHWVGKGDCADNTCADTEVVLRTDDRGDSSSSCNWYRKKSLCCTPNLDTLTTMTCDVDACEGGVCGEDGSGIDDDPEAVYKRSLDLNAGADAGQDTSSLRARSYERTEGDTWYSYDEDIDVHQWIERALSKGSPGAPRGGILKLPKIIGTSIYGLELPWKSRPYPSGLNVFKGDGASTISLPGGYGLLKDTCSATAVTFTHFRDLPKTGFHAEHLREIQMIPQFLTSCLSNRLPSGATMKTIVNFQALVANWNKEIPASLPQIGATVTDVVGWTAPLTPNDRVFEVIGSYAYRTGLSALQGNVNLAKGFLMGLKNPVSPERMAGMLKAVAAGAADSEDLAKKVMAMLQATPAVFNYINDGGLESAWTQSGQMLAKQIQYTAEYMPGLDNLLDAWNEFEPDYYSTVVSFASTFYQARLTAIQNYFANGGDLSNPVINQMLFQTAELAKALSQIKLPSFTDSS